MYLQPTSRPKQGAYMRLLTMEPLYVVEDYGEWMFAVYEDYIISIDYYEGFAEITFFTQHL